MTATTTFAASGLSVESAVRAAVAAVNDPEYPDVSILDLGLLESLRVEFVTEHGAEGAVAHVGLIPTFSNRLSRSSASIAVSSHGSPVRCGTAAG